MNTHVLELAFVTHLLSLPYNEKPFCGQISLRNAVLVIGASCKATRKRRSLDVIRANTRHSGSQPLTVIHAPSLSVFMPSQIISIQQGAFLLDFVLSHLLGKWPSRCPGLVTFEAARLVSLEHRDINHCEMPAHNGDLELSEIVKQGTLD